MKTNGGKGLSRRLTEQFLEALRAHIRRHGHADGVLQDVTGGRQGGS